MQLSQIPSTLLKIATFHSFTGYIIVVYIYHIFFIQLSISGHRGYLHVLTIVNNVTVNVMEHMRISVDVLKFYRNMNCTIVSIFR